jgi:hypothetical protein
VETAAGRKRVSEDENSTDKKGFCEKSKAKPPAKAVSGKTVPVRKMEKETL